MITPASIQFPVTVQIGTVSILLHNILEPLSYFVGFRYFVWLRKKQGDHIDTSNRIWILIGAIFGSFAGSRLVAGFEDPDQLKKASSMLWYFYQNKTILGGLLGGLAGVEITKKIIGEYKPSGDLLVYPILLALIIGRIGCFSMGIYEATYGLPSKLPWAMFLGDNIKRHPITLYEILFLVDLWFLLYVLAKKIPLAPGALFKVFLFSYCLFRFLVEFVKPHVPLVAELSAIQLAALAGMIYYYRYILNPSLLLQCKTE